MAKNIPSLLLSQFSKSGTSACFAVKIITKENEVFGFTNVDFSLAFDDGFGLQIYSPLEELAPQNLQSSADMTVDNTKLVGWFREAVEQKILAGVFDSAEITIYRVSYLNLNYGQEVVAFGRVGEIDYNSDAKDKRKIEFRSLAQQLTKNANEVFSLTCRAEFGDAQCKKSFEWEPGTLEILPNQDAYLIFKVNGIARPANYFELGVVHILSGPNSGANLEIESWDLNGAIVKLSFVAPYPLTTGVQARFRKDCGKTETDCIAYNNIVNMRAEHLTPTQDQSIMVPGAYIKSQTAL